MKRDSCRHSGPPWWPAGEPWPAHHGAFGSDRRARARFFRRVAIGAAATFMLVISGLLAFAWIIAERFSPGGRAAAMAAVLVLGAAGMLVTAMVAAMRRFASPLGAIMDAAESVADGDYAVRVREHGPPPLRALARSFNTMTERLQHADRLRRDLMADVSHELRTPLTVVQGRLEGLLDGVYPRDDRHIAEVLEDTQVLSRLIDDLRTLALSDAGALQLQKEPTDLVGLVQEVVRSMQAEAARKSVTLDVTGSPHTTVIDIDGLRIREVLTNLLSNALRHTPAGRSVAVSLSETVTGLEVAVRDTGEGMAAEHVARIFDRFYKGSTSRGSGLGLTIARSIVTVHGGDITASSQRGSGTVVTFTLPR
jgi:two-component system sensor histidine kinase BaeS